MQYCELMLLEKLLALTAADADLEYSILRGKLDADDVRAICQGLQVAIETLRGKATRIDNHESRPYHSPAVSVEN